MHFLVSLAEQISTLNRFIGKSVAWCSLFLVLLVFVIAILRYMFKIGSIPMQELVIYLHGIIFMLGASYTLADDGHVRVDVIYSRMSDRAKGWVNLLGALLFLVPVTVYILYSSIDYVTLSWRIGESSPEAGGLPYLFLLKSLLLLMPILLFLQGIAIAIKNIITLLDKQHDKRLTDD